MVYLLKCSPPDLQFSGGRPADLRSELADLTAGPYHSWGMNNITFVRQWHPEIVVRRNRFDATMGTLILKLKPKTFHWNGSG